MTNTEYEDEFVTAEVLLTIGDKKVGRIGIEKTYVYTTYRNFYKAQYNLEQAYYFEIELIELLRKQNVSLVRIIEFHNNETSGIKEETIFLFPLSLLYNTSDVPLIHHNSRGFGEQTGLKRQTLLPFIVKGI